MTAIQNAESKHTESAGQRRQTDVGSSRDLELVLRLIELLQQSATRQQAGQRLVRMFSQMLPGRRVVLAIGSTNRCRLAIDSQVGLLAKESPAAREIQSAWNSTSLSLAGPANWQLALPGQTDQIAWLLISDDPLLSMSLKQILNRSADVIGQVLWSRPAWVFGASEVWRSKESRFKIGIAVSAVLLLCLFPIQYRVPCLAHIEPLAQRIVAAPFEAQLETSEVRPGDKVTAGQTLGQLDGRPLRMQREALRADLEQANKTYDVALAADKVADAQLARLERDRIGHELDLINDRLESLTIRCPIDGIVVAGDLRKSQGVPFAMGDPLFEIAPLDQMIVEVEIPDMDIRFADAGSAAKVRVAALGHSIRGELQRIYPQAEVRDNRNVFIGMWETQNEDRQLRPGMQGPAIVYGPYRPLAWRWIRRMYEGTLRAIGW